MRWPLGKHACLLLCVVSVLAAIGCADDRPQRVRASGRVLIDGKPLEHGFVQVAPDGDRAATGQIGPEGRFSLTTFDDNDGVVPGTHRVAVVAVESQGPTSQRWHAPKKYMSVDTSGLTIEVDKPTDSLEIKLSWDGAEPFVEQFEKE